MESNCEILNDCDLPYLTFDMETSSERATRIDPSRILKRGYSPHVYREAEAMAFVRANTSIPVPRVLEVGETGKDEEAYLIMEFVEGVGVDEAWKQMTDASRSYVIVQLRAYIAEMRALPQPHPGWIESCSGGAAMDHRVNNAEPFGPLHSVHDFHNLLLARYKRHSSPDRYRSTRSRLFDGHSVVFTHADLGARHILVDPTTGKVVAIIDWEMAGFWPEYWEYRKARYGFCDTELWRDCVHQIMQSYVEEWSTDEELEYF
ncbi:hypothetical protein PLICRDRAFT_281547 [Plicaturopsis crispa FD-325 SS-3]|nr:hypothetical protein PLICRDRAFT_281547 [Plicaturopsis crispa FD-325 SS-3]